VYSRLGLPWGSGESGTGKWKKENGKGKSPLSHGDRALSCSFFRFPFSIFLLAANE
jgi:hypothetical protein